MTEKTTLSIKSIDEGNSYYKKRFKDIFYTGHFQMGKVCDLVKQQQFITNNWTKTFSPLEYEFVIDPIYKGIPVYKNKKTGKNDYSYVEYYKLQEEINKLWNIQNLQQIVIDKIKELMSFNDTLYEKILKDYDIKFKIYAFNDRLDELIKNKISSLDYKFIIANKSKIKELINLSNKSHDNNSSGLLETKITTFNPITKPCSIIHDINNFVINERYKNCTLEIQPSIESRCVIFTNKKGEKLYTPTEDDFQLLFDLTLHNMRYLK